jgi:endonuclease III
MTPSRAKKTPRNSAAGRFQRLHDELLKVYGPQDCRLTHANPLQLLVATILSAQCTDAMVNSVTPELFKLYPDVKSFAGAVPGELELMIRKCGYFRAKARHIVEACEMILKDFGGKVPDDIERLTLLPGVGRKTANVVLSDAFGVPGFPVDTHVKRLLNLIGAVASDAPERIEAEVCALLPSKFWGQFSHLLIAHGRARCVARRPDCGHCEILKLCRHGSKRISK